MQYISEIQLNKSNWKESLSFIFLTGFLFLMPFGTQRNNFMIAGFILFTIINRDFYKSFGWIWKNNKALWLPVAYFFVLALGMLYSSNFDAAYVAWQRTAALFIFPIFMPYVVYKFWSKRNVLSVAFVSGVVASAIYLLGLAFYHSFSYQNGVWIVSHQTFPTMGFSDWYAITHGYSNFSYDNLSKFMHPGYFSYMINMAILVLYVQLRSKHISLISKIAYVVLLVFLVAFLFLITSRSGIMAFLGIVAFAFFWEIYYYKHRHSKWLALMGIVVFVLLGVFLFNTKFVTVYEQLKNYDKPNYDGDYKSKTDDRLIIWFIAWDAIQQNFWIGAGSGNTKEVLKSKYDELGFSALKDHEYNCHNQYLESTLQAGIVNGILLLAMLFCMIYIGFRYKKPHYIFAGMAFVVFFMFESVLLRINGSYLFAVVYTVAVLQGHVLSSNKETPAIN